MLKQTFIVICSEAQFFCSFWKNLVFYERGGGGRTEHELPGVLKRLSFNVFRYGQ